MLLFRCFGFLSFFLCYFVALSLWTWCKIGVFSCFIALFFLVGSVLQQGFINTLSVFHYPLWTCSTHHLIHFSSVALSLWILCKIDVFSCFIVLFFLVGSVSQQGFINTLSMFHYPFWTCSTHHLIHFSSVLLLTLNKGLSPNFVPNIKRI